MKKKNIDFEKEILVYKDKMVDKEYAKAFYAALCNMQWRHFTQEKDLAYGCSWRYAGGLIAKIRDAGEDYMDFYCSGREGMIRKDVLRDLQDIGFRPLTYERNKKDIEIY